MYDSAYPNHKVQDYVQVQVNRNAYAPIFSPLSYDKKMSDDYPLVTQVLRVAATDRDGDNVTYQLLNSDPISAIEFFYMEPDTGRLMLKKSLKEAQTSSFKVYINFHIQQHI